MADPAALELYATVIEEDYTVTEAGLLVDVFFDAMPERTVLGRIVRIVPEKLPGDRPLYAIYVELEEVPDGMAEGMTADAEIIIDSREDVVRLPRTLVKARSDGSAEIELWRNNQEVNRTIQTGLRGDVYIEILDGLQEGDLVVGR
jgi:HlyD family secretion protein